MRKDIEARREYQRLYWRKKNKGGVVKLTNTVLDKFPYKVVPNTWRNRVTTREPYTTDIPSPIVNDILDGKTILVDHEMPLGFKNNPFRTLYPYFTSRGYRLHIHVVDDVEKGQFRRILMWADPLIEERKARSA